MRALVVALLTLVAGALIFGGATAAGTAPAKAPGGQPDLETNVIVFDPSMPTSQIQAKVDSIASQQVDNEMGSER